MDTAAVLERFIALLEDEKKLLGKTLADPAKTAVLQRITEEKGTLLETLSRAENAELKAHDAAMRTVKELSDINRQIAQSNMLFIEDVFAAVFKDSASQYDESGVVTSKKEGLINKKI